MATHSYDLEALKQDIPNAKELAQFVFDKTGKSMDLLGKNKDKAYAAAHAVLEGKVVGEEWFSDKNPYVDQKDLVPEDPLKEIPAKNKAIPGEEDLFSFHLGMNFPHPQDPNGARKCKVMFRKYRNGMVTYQVLGPIEKIAVGTKKNKHGEDIPEKYTWMDPRTPETIIRKENGSFTEEGLRMYEFCTSEKGSNVWVAIDRSVVSGASTVTANPW